MTSKCNEYLRNTNYRLFLFSCKLCINNKYYFVKKKPRNDVLICPLI